MWFDMSEGNTNVNKDTDVKEPVLCRDMENLFHELSQMKEDMAYLKDLFVRRLNDDKQKGLMIQKLTEGATYAFIEPFLTDLILLLDRLEKKADDDFVLSIHEELYDILHRRGVELVEITTAFNPTVQKAVKVGVNPDVNCVVVKEILRNGYRFNGRVIRPAEVVVEKPNTDEK